MLRRTLRGTHATWHPMGGRGCRAAATLRTERDDRIRYHSGISGKNPERRDSSRYLLHASPTRLRNHIHGGQCSMPNAAPHIAATAPEVIGLPAFSPQVKATIRFLIVDDERTLRESCASLLQIDGYQVSVASRGQEALELLRHRRFDIVRPVLYMSDIPGYQLLRTAMETSPETIVIVMTGNPSVPSSVEALRWGAWDYLPKPFSPTPFPVLTGRA